MYMTETDKHCLLDAFKTSKLTTTTSVFSGQHQSKWIAGISAVAIFAAIQLSTSHYTVNQHRESTISPATNIYRVEVDGKRMTAQEKLDYDLAPAQIARVEIVGHRS